MGERHPAGSQDELTHEPRSAEFSRREWLKAGAVAGVAAAWSTGAVAQSQELNAAILDRITRSSSREDRRILIKDATIISMDPAIGDFLRGSILIQGKKIVAVGPDDSSQASDANTIVVPAEGMIVIPGMIDCHRHAWEGQIRGIIPNSASIGDYMAATHRGFAPFYRPEDVYVGNLTTALGCIDAGITCLIDNSHNSRSSAHSDAAIRALFDSGIRAVHASGAPTFSDWDQQWPADIARLQKQYFNSEDQLVTLRMFSRGLVKEDWQTAERLGLWISIDGAGGPNSAKTLLEFRGDGLVNERRTFNHGYALPQESWAIIRDAGITINVCPRSDSQWALGTASMGLQDALSNGIRPGLCVDNDTAFSTDLFTEMRVAFHLQRWVIHTATGAGQSPAFPRITVRDLLEFATIRGAQNAALQHKVGSLSVGKEADLVLIRAEDINTMPLTNAVATVVSYAHAGNIHAVFVAGQIRKWNGVLVGRDMNAFAQRVRQSRDYLYERRGIKLDVLA